MANFAVQIPNPAPLQFDGDGNLREDYQPRIVVGVEAVDYTVDEGVLMFFNSFEGRTRGVRALASGEWFTVVRLPEGEDGPQ